MSIGHEIDGYISYAATGARLLAGLYLDTERYGIPNRPAKPIDLYDFENSPYCRIVRDALTMLGLQAMVYPCPKGGKTFRAKVRELGGKEQFPFIHDPNTGRSMYESADIVKYLYETYGDGQVPVTLQPWLAVPSSNLLSLFRIHRGREYTPARQPQKPLVLYSFEESPYCRLVRERLSELELPYHLINIGKAPGMSLFPETDQSIRTNPALQKTELRRDFVEKSGLMMVPYLIDPNTGTALFESEQINDYLTATYAL